MKESLKSALPQRRRDHRRSGFRPLLRGTGGRGDARGVGRRALGLRTVPAYFLVATAALLVFGFWQLDREEKAACEPGKPCADPATRRRRKITLWVATVIAVIFATFPSWQTLLL